MFNLQKILFGKGIFAFIAAWAAATLVLVFVAVLYFGAFPVAATAGAELVSVEAGNGLQNALQGPAGALEKGEAVGACASGCACGCAAVADHDGDGSSDCAFCAACDGGSGSTGDPSYVTPYETPYQTPYATPCQPGQIINVNYERWAPSPFVTQFPDFPPPSANLGIGEALSIRVNLGTATQIDAVNGMPPGVNFGKGFDFNTGDPMGAWWINGSIAPNAASSYRMEIILSNSCGGGSAYYYDVNVTNAVPDLQAINPTTTVATTTAGNIVTLSGAIRNIGGQNVTNATFDNRFRIRRLADNVWVNSDIRTASTTYTLPGYFAGMTPASVSKSYRIPVGWVPGQYGLSLCADELGSVVAESNEANNCSAESLFTVAVFQCSDGADNADPEDTLADYLDPGCHSDGNPGNTASYVPTDNDETHVPGITQCSDGIDNADPEDAFADIIDAGCHTDGNAGNAGSYDPNDDNETNNQCSDGIDNDSDGVSDGADPGCSNSSDDDETDPPPGGGGGGNPTLTINADPAIVGKNGNSTISWTITGTDPALCTVNGSNGDGPWAGNTSPQTSSDLTAATLYTLTCSGTSEDAKVLVRVNFNIIEK